MSGPASSAPRGSGSGPLLGLAILGVLGLFGRKPAPSLAVASTAGGGGGSGGGGSRPAGAAGANQGGRSMPSDREASGAHRHGDSAPGESKQGGTDVAAGVRGYAIGLGLAALLTAGSFWLSYTHLVYGPGITVALIVFAVAQIGIHLVFFLHLTTSPDNTNNAMALAFGVLILLLLIGGTLWIMGHMNANMMPMNGMGHAMPMSPAMNMAP